MQACDLENIGIIKSQAGPELMKIVGDEVAKIQADFSRAVPKNGTLAGNIIHEYQLFDSVTALEAKTREMAMMHSEVYGQGIDAEFLSSIASTDKSKKPDLRLKNAWVNFQQKGEFNPIHNHTGMYSFVLWYKIPYYENIEASAGPGRLSKSNVSGKFAFQYTNILGNIVGAEFPADKKWEGIILLFPAQLHHQVYPFYSSNNYRISISGNLFLETGSI
jgi:hypothetical protein